MRFKPRERRRTYLLNVNGELRDRFLTMAEARRVGHRLKMEEGAVIRIYHDQGDRVVLVFKE